MEITLTLSLDEINNLINLFNHSNAILHLKDREFKASPSGNVVRLNEWLEVYENLSDAIFEASTTIEQFQKIKKYEDENK